MTFFWTHTKTKLHFYELPSNFSAVSLTIFIYSAAIGGTQTFWFWNNHTPIWQEQLSALAFKREETTQILILLISLPQLKLENPLDSR